MAGRNPLTNHKTGRARAQTNKAGSAGYDNIRENIDPHVRTKAISTIQISSGATVMGDLQIIGNLSGGNIATGGAGLWKHNGNFIEPISGGNIVSGAGFNTSGTISGASASLAGMSITNDGIKTTFLGTAGDYNRIGDAATPSSRITNNDDLYVSNRLEVEGNVYMGPNLYLNDPEKCRLFYESAPGTTQFSWECRFDTDEYLMWIPSAVGRQIVFASRWETDYGHPNQASATLFLHSDSVASSNEYLSLTHNATDGLISAGKGHLKVSAASGGLLIPNSTEQSQIANSGIIFVSGAALYYKGGSGTITKIANA